MSDFLNRVFDIINEKDPDLIASVIAQIEQEEQEQADALKDADQDKEN